MLMLDFDKEGEKEAWTADFYQNVQRWYYDNFLSQWDSVTDALQIAKRVWLVLFALMDKNIYINNLL